MSMAMARIHVLELPVELWRRTQEHTDELIREFMLIASEERQEQPSGHTVPTRLLTVIDELTQRYAGFGEENETKLADAAERGDASIALVYVLSVDVSDDFPRLGGVLGEADDFFRQVEHL